MEQEDKSKKNDHDKEDDNFEDVAALIVERTRYSLSDP
jgi:hypothetical protein